MLRRLRQYHQVPTLDESGEPRSGAAGWNDRDNVPASSPVCATNHEPAALPTSRLRPHHSHHNPTVPRDLLHLARVAMCRRTQRLPESVPPFLREPDLAPNRLGAVVLGCPMAPYLSTSLRQGSRSVALCYGYLKAKHGWHCLQGHRRLHHIWLGPLRNPSENVSLSLSPRNNTTTTGPKHAVVLHVPTCRIVLRAPGRAPTHKASPFTSGLSYEADMDMGLAILEREMVDGDLGQDGHVATRRAGRLLQSN